MKFKLFYQCLLISLALHIVALWIFCTQPLLLQPIFSSIFRKSVTSTVISLGEEDIDLSEKNITLEEVFNQMIVLAPSVQKPYDFEEMSLLNSTTYPLPETAWESVVSDVTVNLPPSFEAQKELASSPPILSTDTDLINAPLIVEVSLPPMPYPIFNDDDELGYIYELEEGLSPSTETFYDDSVANLSIHYPPSTEEEAVKKEILSSPEEMPFLPLNFPEMIAMVPLEELKIETPPFNAASTAPHFFAKTESFPRRLNEPKLKSLPALTSYSLPFGPSALEWSDGFAVEVKTAPSEAGGFLFSLTLSPNYDMRSKKMVQNITFLIDCTNSIEKHRYQTFKRGIYKALSSLRDGDKFNVVILDKKITSFKEAPILYSKKSLQLVESFLEKQLYNDFSATGDIYERLLDAIPSSIAENEENSVILISDGDSLQKSTRKGRRIRAFLEKSSENFTLYTAAVGQGNNLPMLDLLSSFCRGSILYSDTHAAFPRKLANLVVKIRYPIAKDLTIAAIKADPESHLQLFPSQGRLPTLFGDRPLTLFGKADKLSDFTLMLQGRGSHDAFTIKKLISFSGAKTSPNILEREEKKYQAHLYYDQYLQQNKIAFLEKAKESFLHVAPNHRR